MSFAIAIRAEMIKNRRGAAFWMCLIGSSFIPPIFFLTYVLKPERNYSRMAAHPWEVHFQSGWQAFSLFLLPMFVILSCSLIVQVEYRNNTWKQVFSSPLSLGNIFFSKYLSILCMILFMLVMFNVFLLAAGVFTDLIYPRYTFLEQPVDWGAAIKMNIRSFISLMGIIAFQYWLSLRFRNFIVPVGIGLTLLVATMVMMPWVHIDKVPYAFAFLSYTKSGAPSGAEFPASHEINSVLYFLLFTLVAFADMRFRKERG